MTSPAYSDRRVFWHELRLTIRQFWLLPVAGAVYFFLVMNLPLLLILDSYSYSGYANFEMYVQGYDAGIQYAIPVFAGLVALCVFFFLFQARATDTYFSLGVRRGTLFGIRYLTGAAFVALPLLLACLCSLFAQLAVQPVFYGVFFRSWLYVTLLMMVGGLAMYSLAVLVITLCGTVSEGVVYTLLASILPLLLAWIAGSVLQSLLPGCPYGAGFSHLSEPPYGGVMFEDGIPISLVEAVKLFTPFSFHFYDISTFQSVYFENGDASTAINTSYRISVSSPHWGMLAGWALFVAAAALLAYLLFRRRRAEISGFAGSCRPLGIAAAVLAALFTFAALQYLPVSLPLRVLCGLLGAAAALVLAGMIAFRGVGWLKKSWPALPATAGGLLVAAVVLATGLFGYSARVPAVQEIAQASITYHGDPNRMEASEIMSGVYISTVYMPSGPYASAGDLERIVSLHEKLARLPLECFTSSERIADGDVAYQEAVVNGPVFVEYTLKNGRTMARRYATLPLSLMEEFLQLDETQAISQAWEEKLRLRLFGNGKAEEDRGYQPPEDIYLYSPSLLLEEAPLDLTTQEREQLLDCLLADLEGQTLQDHYFPEEDAVLLLSLGYYDSMDSCTLFLTPSFTRTLDFLLAQGRYTLPEPPEILRATAYRFVPENRRGYSCGQDLFLQASGDSGPEPSYPIYDAERYGNPREIPAELLDDLVPCLRSSYYASREVYMVELEAVNPAYDPNAREDPNSTSYSDHLATQETLTIYKLLPVDAIPDSLQAYL